MESYLYHSDLELRSALCRIRISAHSLKIERGRYKKLSVDERTCNHCSGKAVEDELHFICQCSHYSYERNKPFLKISKTYPSFYHLTDQQKSIFLLKSSNSFIYESVGQFIFHCLRKRSQTHHIAQVEIDLVQTLFPFDLSMNIISLLC